MHGLHLTADLRGCAADHPAMVDRSALRDLCLGAVTASGLRPVGELFHQFAAPAAMPAVASSVPPGVAPVGGVTGVVLLAESHLAVHTWPELGAVTLDVYVCNFGADHGAQAEQLLQRLLAAFAPAQPARVQRLQRGAAGLGPADVPAPLASACPGGVTP